MRDKMAELRDRYIAAKMRIPLAKVKRARHRKWYVRFRDLFGKDLRIPDFERMLLVWRFLDDISAFHRAWISESAMESLMIYYQDTQVKDKTEEELTRMIFQEAV